VNTLIHDESSGGAPVSKYYTTHQLCRATTPDAEILCRHLVRTSSSLAKVMRFVAHNYPHLSQHGRCHSGLLSLAEDRTDLAQALTMSPLAAPLFTPNPRATKALPTIASPRAVPSPVNLPRPALLCTRRMANLRRSRGKTRAKLNRRHRRRSRNALDCKCGNEIYTHTHEVEA